MANMLVKEKKLVDNLAYCREYINVRIVLIRIILVEL